MEAAPKLRGTKAPNTDIGLVIASGLLVGTCFTLFVVPTIYTYLAADHRQDDFD